MKPGRFLVKIVQMMGLLTLEHVQAIRGTDPVLVYRMVGWDVLCIVYNKTLGMPMQQSNLEVTKGQVMVVIRNQSNLLYEILHQTQHFIAFHQGHHIPFKKLETSSNCGMLSAR